jgi:hypothetical protein
MPIRKIQQEPANPWKEEPAPAAEAMVAHLIKEDQHGN